MVVKIIQECLLLEQCKFYKSMSNLIINKQDYNFNGELFPPKLQCPNQFKKCPCINYE